MAKAFAVEYFKISVKQQRRKMGQKHFKTCLFAVLTFVLANLSSSDAKPSPKPTPTFGGYYSSSSGNAGIERFDYDYYQPPTYAEPLTESRLTRLRRGYYYVDDGYITPVAASALPTAERRQDAIRGGGGGGERNSVQYTPLVKYKHTRTKKHKKLFVPNLFG